MIETINEYTDEQLKSQEIWQAATEGTTFVQCRDPRNRGAYVTKHVGGTGGKRITLTLDERLFNQSLVAYGGEQHDPFSNGMLVRVHPKDAVDRSRFELTDAELLPLVTGGSDEEFEQTVEKIDSEVILRRMLNICETQGTKRRYDLLERNVIDRYRVTKSSRVALEEEEARERAAI